AKKPFIERQFDKLVLNVESSIISAGSSAFEILEKAPGVTIDQNDNISLKGKSGVIFMIDGKITPVSGQDLAAMLKGLPSSSIEKIELITNPSARYDASGTAGIINIKMKKDQRMGTNGTFTISLGYGKYWRHNEGISFNHRNKKLNVFGNYNFSGRKQFIDLALKRRFFNENTDTMTGGFDQVTNATQTFVNHTGRLGLDLFASKKTIIGIVLNVLANDQGRHYDSYAKVLNYKESVDSMFTTLNRSHEILDHYGINLNLKHVFDSTGKDLSVDLDYAKFSTDMDPRLDVIYYDVNGTVKGAPYSLIGISQGRLNIYSLKADYTHPIKKIAKIETGIKSSYVKADNDLVFHQVINGVTSYDSSKSNHFIYQENINAFYLNISRAWKKINLQFGIRAEQANVKGNQLTTHQVFDSSYLKLFPSATANYILKNKDILGLSVSRRITRPGYNQLNPFKYFIDPSSYRTGNPGLLPQFTYSYEFSYTHKQTILALSYSKTKNNLLAVIIPEVEGNKIYSVETTRNLATVHGLALDISSSLRIAKWWNTQNNLDIYYNKYTGNLANTPLDDGIPVLSMNSTSSFSLGKNWLGECNLSFRSKQVVGYLTTRSVFRMAAGIQQSILKKAGTLRLNITDIFHSDLIKNVSSFKIYRQEYNYVRNTRFVTLTFSYRFGKNTVARARQRTGGAEEERGRAN
ncbi:MAG TPA: outer membrane beta-barrel protein, partial [Chitinophagaceae bacterium]|nr:outer membrane beta-barrel protein [Chitinophagaceae bacterium]